MAMEVEKVTERVEDTRSGGGAGEIVEITNEQVFLIPEDRKLGFASTAFLIVNKMIGSGIFATPAGVLAASGSVGVSLILWMLGGVLTCCGLMVYLEFGLAIPKSGGEKVYLERVYTRPKYIATCVFAVLMILLGNSAGNTITFGRYVLLAAGKPNPTPREQRSIAVGALTFCCLLHSFLPKWGVRLSNALGLFKIVILLLIVLSGFAALAGKLKAEKPDNFRDTFDGSTRDAYNYAMALLNVIYSYQGWENANYVLSEVKNPQKTLKVAAPVAVLMVAVLYMLANIAYLAAIPKEDIVKSGVTVAGKFFINVFGNNAATRALPVIVSLSAFGNVLAVTFANPRVKQELAKEGVLPFSRFFASDWPLKTPAAAILLHWVFSVITIVGPPAGDAFVFVVSLFTYSGAWVGGFVGAGLLWLQYQTPRTWTSPFHSWVGFTVIFTVSNIFLVVVPFIPPSHGASSTPSIPFYVFPIVGTLVIVLGVVYWFLFARALPHFGGYSIEVEKHMLENGAELVRYKKVKHA